MLQKDAVLRALAASLRADLDAVEAAARATRDGATHEESKAEDEKDTRAIEAGYLAGAQSARAAELLQAVNAVEKASPAAFSLVTLEEKGKKVVVLLSRVGGGQKLVVDGVTIQVVTPQSPLGQAVEGKAAGDDVDVPLSIGRGGARVRSLVLLERE